MENGIHNAMIDDATLFIERGMLTSSITMNYGDQHQGFGGYALYVSSDYDHHNRKTYAGYFLYRVLEIAGVDSWEKLKGKTVRVRIENGLIKAIGHIIKDDWFTPSINLSDD